MRAKVTRPVVAGLTFLTVSLMGLQVMAGAAGSGPAAASNSNQWRATTMEAPSELVALMANRDLMSPQSAAPNQSGVTVIEVQGFDDEAFPPTGWFLEHGDPQEGQPDAVDYDRETCERAPDPHSEQEEADNVASAWSVGGGSTGASLPCRQAYTSTVLSYLVFGPIDTRGMDGGLRVTWASLFDMPIAASNENPDLWPHGICVVITETDATCAVPNSRSTQGDWVPFDPFVFAAAAGLERTFVYVLYRDFAPTGAHFGAFIDNIVIEGLGEAPPTQTPGGPTLPPPPPDPDEGILLPVALKKDGWGSVPGVAPLEPGAGVDFGTGWRNGRLVNPGSVFQYGHPVLCARNSWWGLEVGTPFRWQWYQNSQPIAPNDSTINRSFQVERRTGHAESCLRAADGGPIPRGTFSVNLYIDDAQFPSATGQVVIQDAAPPGASPIPASPTPFPTAEPSATPTPGAGPDCRQFLRNGDMEDGPVVWRHGMNPIIQEHIGLENVIRNDINTAGGDWAAQLGGFRVTGQRFIDELSQPSSPTGHIEASRLLSATLTFWAGMSTEEQPNGTVDDPLVIGFQSRTNPDLPALGIGQISEESIQPNVFLAFEADVTENLTSRPDWFDSTIIFQSQQNDVRGSFHFLDEVVLEVCRTPALTDDLPVPAQAIARGLGPRVELSAPVARLVDQAQPAARPLPLLDASTVPVLRPVAGQAPRVAPWAPRQFEAVSP